MDAQGNLVQENLQTLEGVQYSVEPNGVIYVMNGPAGSQTREPHQDYDKSAYYYAKRSNHCSWADFSIYGNTLTVTAQYATADGVNEYAKRGI